MRFSRMSAAALLAAPLTFAAAGAGAMTIDFEGIVPPGEFVDNTASTLTIDGFNFAASGQSFLLSDGLFNIGVNRVDNDSDYLVFATFTTVTQHTLTITTESGLPFSVEQFDAVESTTSLPGSYVIEAAGFFAAGGSIETSFTTAPHDQGTLGEFQTFFFGSGFSGLDSLVLTMQAQTTVDELSIDNLVAAAVPLPGAALLLMPALALLQRIGSKGRRSC